MYSVIMSADQIKDSGVRTDTRTYNVIVNQLPTPLEQLYFVGGFTGLKTLANNEVYGNAPWPGAASDPTRYVDYIYGLEVMDPVIDADEVSLSEPILKTGKKTAVYGSWDIHIYAAPSETFIVRCIQYYYWSDGLLYNHGYDGAVVTTDSTGNAHVTIGTTGRVEHEGNVTVLCLPDLVSVGTTHVNYIHGQFHGYVSK